MILEPPRLALVCSEHKLTPGSCERTAYKAVHCEKGRTEPWEAWECSGVTVPGHSNHASELHLEILELVCENISPDSCHLVYEMRKSADAEFYDACGYHSLDNPRTWIFMFTVVPGLTLTVTVFVIALLRVVHPVRFSAFLKNWAETIDFHYKNNAHGGDDSNDGEFPQKREIHTD